MATKSRPPIQLQSNEMATEEGEGQVPVAVADEKVPRIAVFPSNKLLWTTFALAYLANSAQRLLGTTITCLLPYVVSHFASHSLLPLASMTSLVVGGVLRLAMAKLIDEWGRLRGVLAAVAVSCAGLVVMATCRSITAYIAGQILYGVGAACFDYVAQILVADMTSLRHRALGMGVLATPFVAASFAGPSLAQVLIRRTGFRWGYAVLVVTWVLLCVPLVVALFLAQRAADTLERRRGSARTTVPSAVVVQRTWVRAVKEEVVALDLLGIVLAGVGLCMVLLPLTLTSKAGEGWHSPKVIAMLVCGVASLVGFFVWERWWTPTTFMPWRLMRNRNILGGCLVVMLAYVSIECWFVYYNSYLQVVHGQSIATAGMITNAFPLAYAIGAPIYGLIISMTGRYKYTAFCAIPFLATATGLLLLFHKTSDPIGLPVMCLIFLGLTEMVLAGSSQLAVVATIPHNDIAVVVGIWGTFISVGMAIGIGVAGGIWNNVFRHALLEALPAESKALAVEIAGSLVLQLGSALDSPVRSAVVAAYWAAQQKMLIAGLCPVPLAGACVLLWQNVKVRKLEGVDGVVEEESVRARGKIW